MNAILLVDFLKNSLLSFTNNDFRKWLHDIGIPTYVGSSKRVYPEEHIKPITVLNTILNHLKNKGINFKYNHVFSGWDIQNNLIINNEITYSDYTVFSLGGGSWKITGSDGAWLKTFEEKGLKQFLLKPLTVLLKLIGILNSSKRTKEFL